MVSVNVIDCQIPKQILGSYVIKQARLCVAYGNRFKSCCRKKERCNIVIKSSCPIHEALFVVQKHLFTSSHGWSRRKRSKSTLLWWTCSIVTMFFHGSVLVYPYLTQQSHNENKVLCCMKRYVMSGEGMLVYWLGKQINKSNFQRKCKCATI